MVFSRCRLGFLDGIVWTTRRFVLFAFKFSLFLLLLLLSFLQIHLFIFNVRLSCVPYSFWFSFLFLTVISFAPVPWQIHIHSIHIAYENSSNKSSSNVNEKWDVSLNNLHRTQQRSILAHFDMQCLFLLKDAKLAHLNAFQFKDAPFEMKFNHH